MIRLSDDHPVIRSSGYPTRHFVRKITLSHFRNYRFATAEASADAIVLLGPNGAGKTNLLEAVSLLAPGRGLRRAALSDIDNAGGKDAWVVSAEITGTQGEVTIGTGRDPESEEGTDKRIVRIDGKAARAQSDLAKLFSVLWLTPQMDNLFIEGGSARRKFLDRLVYSFNQTHASSVNAYDFAMRERNRLLQAGRADPTWLWALEQKMAEHGIAIAAARLQAVEGLTHAMTLAQESFPKADISLSGIVEDALAQSSALSAEALFREQLEQSRAQDGANGRTSIGIHRTLVNVEHRDKKLPAERCSTGEQKALLVSIILAQARAGAMWHGNIPVLLLDEVATHLDIKRRIELFSALQNIGAQVWMTGTDRETFEGLDGQFLSIENGVISGL